MTAKTWLRKRAQPMNIEWMASIGTGESTMTIERQCVSCKRIIEVHTREENFRAWLNREGNIQDCMPDVPDAQRELFLSGLCDDCFPHIDDDDDEEDGNEDEN